METGNNEDTEERTLGRRRCLKFQEIPTTLSAGNRTVIHNSTARQLDEWLRTIPDTPRIDDYGASVGVSTNSLVDQGKYGHK